MKKNLMDELFAGLLETTGESKHKQDDWRGRMTARAAWKLGLISEETYLRLRKEWRASHPKVMLLEKPKP